MRKYPVVLSVAGSDCSGGAGIQADIKAISAFGGYAAAVVTSVTVQNTLGVQAVHALPPEWVEEQMEAVMADLQPEAVKIGMLDSAGVVQAVSRCLAKYKPRHVVYDPVMVSTSGKRLLSEEAVAEVRRLLLPQVSLLTPNLGEAAVLAGHPVRTLEEMKQAGKELAEAYRISVLVKGGHLPGDEMCDVLRRADGGEYTYRASKIASSNLHGTGCTLSSAIATALGKGQPVEEAVRQAKQYVGQAILAARELQVGHGNGPLWHFLGGLAQK